ncbi:DUF4179 domain-containing protein [Ornithinibacillus halotolerans]|uniref:DUF4179 domain-containing protein n=1 Tax=Ornithinibacillus halotolerans TaxID=1274357 RepID=A0A916WAI5_9BACI|nr:DUF4179 domain-containing protein [Ornithinibacillus halotolerans]GGA80253.1 hypothetical protein GCM10008025_24570 [Ornithinibacillus halotolerans]
MEKLHQDIKQMVDHVTIPDEKLHSTVQNALLKATKKEKQTHIKKHHIIAAIASIFVMAFGVLLFQSYEEIASGDHSKKSILFQNGDEGLQRMVMEGKVQDLSLEVEDQGIKVLLKEGYIDNSKMAVSIQIIPDSTITFPEHTSLTYEWLLDGEPIGPPGSERIPTEELISNGYIYIDIYTNFPPTANLEFHISKINEVEGNWSFQFQLSKNEEFIVESNFEVKQDAFGNSLQIIRAELTPSELNLVTNVNLFLDEAVSGFQDYKLAIVGVGSDGERYIPSQVMSTFYDTPRVDGKQGFYRNMKLPRGVNVYSYLIVPYIITYQGEKVTSAYGEGYNYDHYSVPFAEDEIIGAENPIKVEKIKQESDRTVVTYEMDLGVPEFPYIHNRDTEEMTYPISYRSDGSTIEVSYPKIETTKGLEFFMYIKTYQKFPGLQTEINLN